MQYPLIQMVGSTVQFNYTVEKLCQSTVDFPLFVSGQIQMHVTASFTVIIVFYIFFTKHLLLLDLKALTFVWKPVSFNYHPKKTFFKAKFYEKKLVSLKSQSSNFCRLSHLYNLRHTCWDSIRSFPPQC